MEKWVGVIIKSKGVNIGFNKYDNNSECLIMLILLLYLLLLIIIKIVWFIYDGFIKKNNFFWIGFIRCKKRIRVEIEEFL